MATQYTTGLMADVVKEIIKEDILPGFQRSHREFSLLKQVNDTSGMNSRGYQIPVYVEPETSRVWGAEGYTHPEGSSDVDIKMTALIARYSKAFEFSGDMLAFDKPGSKSLLRIKDRFKRLKTNIFVEFSQLFYGDGSGVLGVVVSNTGTAVTLSSTVAQAVGYTFATFGTELLEKGLVVDLYDNTRTTLRGTYTISSITSGTVAVFSADPTGDGITAEDVIVAADSSGYAFKGLHQHNVLTTGTYQDKSRSTYPQLKPRSNDMSGAPLSWGLMNFMEETATFRLDPEDVDNVNGSVKIITSMCQLSKVRQMGANQVQYQGGETTLTLGFNKVKTALGGMWEAFDWCPEHAVYFVHVPSLLLVNAQPLDYTNYGSNGDMVWATTTSGGGRRDAAYGSISWKGQLIGLDPRKQGAMHNLSMDGPRRASYSSRY